MNQAHNPESADNQPLAFDHQAFLQQVSSMPGVYRMLDAKQQVIYVGKAKNLKKRLASYFRKTGLSVKTRSMVSRIQAIEVIQTRTESEALLLENDQEPQTALQHSVPGR